MQRSPAAASDITAFIGAFLETHKHNFMGLNLPVNTLGLESNWTVARYCFGLDLIRIFAAMLEQNKQSLNTNYSFSKQFSRKTYTLSAIKNVTYNFYKFY